jgi:hypothetical protein
LRRRRVEAVVKAREAVAVSCGAKQSCSVVCGVLATAIAEARRRLEEEFDQAHAKRGLAYAVRDG